MIFKIKPKDPHAWKTKFAFLPKKMPGYWFWLEIYKERYVQGVEGHETYQRQHRLLDGWRHKKQITAADPTGARATARQMDRSIRDQIYRWERYDDTVRLIRENFPAETREQPARSGGWVFGGDVATSAATISPAEIMEQVRAGIGHD